MLAGGRIPQAYGLAAKAGWAWHRENYFAIGAVEGGAKCIADWNGPLLMAFIDGFAEGIIGQEAGSKFLSLNGQQQRQTRVIHPLCRRLADQTQALGTMQRFL